MNRLNKIFAILFLTMAVAACTHKTLPSESLDNARHAIADGEYELAVASLDAASSALSDSLASPTQLSELAVLYMIVNDHLVDNDCNLKALEAYRRAINSNADSVNEYFMALSPEETQYMFILNSLSNSIDNASKGIVIPDMEGEEDAEEIVEGEFIIE